MFYSTEIKTTLLKGGTNRKSDPKGFRKGASGGKGTFRETLAGGIDRATPPGRPRKHYVELNLDWETICIEHLRAPLCPRGARRKTKDFR